MMQITQFVGIDVSKATLDICLVDHQGVTVHQHRIDNTVKAIKICLTQLLRKHQASFTDTVFCMEHTGIYTLPLLKWLYSQQAHIWIESGTQIRKSLGAVRGKNDKADSERIAQYAFTHIRKMKAWQAPRPLLQQIAAILSQRERLVNARKQMQTAATEQVGFVDKAIIKLLKKRNDTVIKVLTSQINDAEKQLLALLKEDEKLLGYYKIITSVDGIGMITALYILVTTNEFITISEAKKYACYAGVVPFEHSSGTSIRTKNRVSHMANKTVKALLHMGAIANIRMNGELRLYYDRKVQEGKNKMAVLNAIRNKLILRIFACIQRMQPYQKNYSFHLVET